RDVGGRNRPVLAIEQRLVRGGCPCLDRFGQASGDEDLGSDCHFAAAFLEIYRPGARTWLGRRGSLSLWSGSCKRRPGPSTRGARGKGGEAAETHVGIDRHRRPDEMVRPYP